MKRHTTRFLFCGMVTAAIFFYVSTLPAAESGPAARTNMAADNPNETQNDNRYIIGAGDVLYISLWKDKELTSQVVVLPDGHIVFPLVGELKAEGRTIEELKSEIEKRIDRYVPDPVLTVMVQQVNSMQVYILGKVNRPGSYPLNIRMNVLQALSAAGGLNAFADRNDIKIFRRRGNRTLIKPFQYDKVTDGKSLEQNIALERGDVVVVP